MKFRVSGSMRYECEIEIPDNELEDIQRLDPDSSVEDIAYHIVYNFGYLETDFVEGVGKVNEDFFILNQSLDWEDEDFEFMED